ncbi:Tetraspanin-6 [Capsicum baccatum]|uniref:Tetraspanin-6 n=1 Tax=Capsicum baccatum TaxID=33114 RepID=A0A2G2VGC7_CAPBA|nr:Tetraspanin-6 [Capsicum baccatum]
MYRFSNTVIGFLNLFTLLASIPIIGAGLWMARSSTTCEKFLQTPLLFIGFIILIVSLAGFIGACFHVAWALWLYLFVMLFLIGALMALTMFGFVVISLGGEVDVPGKVYKEYHLQNYSPLLRKRIKDPQYWVTIRACILGSKTCATVITWTPYDYLTKDLTPIQGGFVVRVNLYRQLRQERKIPKQTMKTSELRDQSTHRPILCFGRVKENKTCFLDFQEIRDPPRLMKNPLTER